MSSSSSTLEVCQISQVESCITMILTGGKKNLSSKLDVLVEMYVLQTTHVTCGYIWARARSYLHFVGPCPSHALHCTMCQYVECLLLLLPFRNITCTLVATCVLLQWLSIIATVIEFQAPIYLGLNLDVSHCMWQFLDGSMQQCLGSFCSLELSFNSSRFLVGKLVVLLTKPSMFGKL